MDSDVKIGQVGNLSNKTVVELKELLTRQETILKNVKIIQNLPDKGEKIKAFRDSLIRHIQEKSPVTKVKGYTDKEYTNDESCLKMQKPKSMFSNNTTKFKSKTDSSKGTAFNGQMSDKPANERDIVRMDHSDICNHGNEAIQTNDMNDLQNNVQTEVSDIQLEKNTVSTKVKAENGSENEFSALRDKELIKCVEARENKDLNERHMSDILRNSDSQSGETVLLSNMKEGVGSNSCDSNGQQIHDKDTPTVHKDTDINSSAQQQTLSVDDIQDKFMDIRLQDSENRNSESDQKLKEKILSNSAEVQPYFKPNSFLKITRIQDLPNKYKFRSRNKQFVNMDTEMTHKSGDFPTLSMKTAEKEESAATPPVYKYKETKLISVTDSVVLLQQQQAKQEKLQTELAAARLAQRLNIKMDKYNPEGTDMSYREKEDEIDSDDECEMTGYDDDET